MLFRLLPPHDDLDQSQIDKGLRGLLYDGVCSQIMGNLTGGAFLVAFAFGIRRIQFGHWNFVGDGSTDPDAPIALHSFGRANPEPQSPHGWKFIYCARTLDDCGRLAILGA